MRAFDIVRHRLDNGLQVVLHRDASQPLVAINLWYHVGSKNERPGRTGFAHLFEHLLFQGSEHVGTNDHFRYVQLAGGVANGSTWYDRTNYYETLPRHYLDLGLWLEADRMGWFLPAIDQAKLDNQREVVMNERRQRVDNQPYGRAFERLHELLYPDEHPYHWPVIGYMEDIAAADLDDVRAFFRTYYAPNNAVLTLAGDLPDDALERVERWFGEIPAGPPVRRPAPAPPALTSERRETMHDQVALPRVYAAWHAPAFGEPEWYVADLLTTALAGGKSSLLYEDLVYRRQLAQDATCFVFPTEESATLAMVATARPEVEPAALEEALFAHFARIATDGVADDDLERARNRLVTSHYNELQTLDQRADLLSCFTTFFDDPERIAEEPRRYAGIGSEDLRAYAAERCRADQRVVLTVLPAARAEVAA